MSIKIVRKVVEKVAYKSTTVNGHVVWRVTFADGSTACTKPNSSFGMTLTGSETGEYEVELDEKGRIVGWEKA